MNEIVIDVSSWQGTINWDAVKKNGKVFGAILQCGYGKDLKKQDDAQFERNYAECKRVGIPVGAYLFSYAKSVEDIDSEFNHIKRLCGNKEWDFPIFIDVESDGVSGADFVRLAPHYNNFLKRIDAEPNMWAGIYTGEWYFNNYVKDAAKPFCQWIAKYSQIQPMGMEYAMWQFTSDFYVNGINGNVDASQCYVDFPALMNKHKNQTPDINVPERVYTVVKGDTLSGIGQKFGIDWKRLAAVNGIKKPNLIYAGTVLRIPND